MLKAMTLSCAFLYNWKRRVFYVGTAKKKMKPRSFKGAFWRYFWNDDL